MTQVLKEKMTHVEKYRKESGPGFSNMKLSMTIILNIRIDRASLTSKKVVFLLLFVTFSVFLK